MFEKGGVPVVPFEMVKFFWRVLLVRNNVMLWRYVAAEGLESGGKGSAPSPDMSRAICRKSPPMGVLGWGEATIARPGVKMRPLTMEITLAS